MRRNLQPRGYKIVYKIYTFLFLALAAFTVGFFLFSIFGSAHNLEWSDYWDIAKFVLLGMAILVLIGVVAKASHRQAR
jgi:hypothetical protein